MSPKSPTSRASILVQQARFNETSAARPHEGEVWATLLKQLRSHGSGADHEDAVCVTVMRVYRRLGRDAGIADASRLARKILHDELVDLRRRRLPLQLSEDALVVSGGRPRANSGATLVPQLPEPLRQRLGSHALELLEYLISGTCENRALARILETSPAAVRQRRQRIVKILRSWLHESIEADAEGASSKR